MAPDPHPPQGTPSGPGPGLRRKPGRATSLVSTLAVVAMAVVAVAAAVMTTRQEEQVAQRAPAAAPGPAREVVKAPPLSPVRPAARTARRAGADAMGAPPGCRNCGVVEAVNAGPNNEFEMHIRMDDGTVRTVGQRGALAAGSRVLVEAGAVRLMPGPG